MVVDFQLPGLMLAQKITMQTSLTARSWPFSKTSKTTRFGEGDTGKGPPFCWETPGFRPAEKCELSRCLWVVVVGENFWWWISNGGIFGSQATRRVNIFSGKKRRHSQYPSYKTRNKFEAGGFKCFFIFTPKLGEDEPNLTNAHIFKRWVEFSTTN